MTLLGIALPSLLLVLALRKWVEPVPWRIAGLFFALTLVFLHGAVFTSKLPVPVDDAARPYPWRGIFGEVTPRNNATNDAVTLFLPWMHVAREEILHLRAPLWNRYSFSGSPLLGNGESAPFSPLFLTTLFVRLPKQDVAMAGLKIFVALLFMFLLMKREGTGDAAAIFAAIAFAWSTVMAIYLYYSLAAVVAFLPAAAFALLRAQADPRKSNVVLVALVVGTLLANGHPESVLHVAIACAALLAVDLAFADDRRAWLKRFRAPLLGTVAGLALSAPAWVPTLEQILLSERLALARSTNVIGSFPLTAAWALVMPNGFGNPLRHNYSWWIGYTHVAFYAGLLPLVMFVAAMIAPKTPGRDRVLGALAVVIFLVAMNSTIIGHAANALPGFAYATNEKLRFVTLFFVIVIGAKALESSPWWAMAAAAAPVVALAGYAYVKQRPLLRPVDLLGAATVIVALLVPRRWAGLLVALELFALNAGFNALVDARYYRPRLPIIDVLRSRAPREPFRIAATGLTFTPNASALYGLEDIRGFDPMAFASYDAYLKRFTVQDAPEMPRRLDDPAAPELDFLNVRYLLTDPTVEPGGRWREIYRGPDGGLFENPGARDRFFSPTARVEEVRELRPGEFSMRVVAPAPATVMSSEVAAPGRRVVVNGASVPIRLLHGVFISFQVPAGQSRVRVEYRAMSYWISVVVAAAAAVLMFGKRAWLDFPRAGP